MVSEELKNLRITKDNLPTLLKMLQADPEWAANLSEDEKQKIIDRANQVIRERFGDW